MREKNDQAAIQRRTGGRSARISRDVMAAALALLNEKGPLGFTMADVAARAGIHPTTLYRRWQTPERLALEAALISADQAVPIPDTGSLKDDLAQLFDDLSRQIDSPAGRALLVLSILAGPEVAPMRDAFWRERLGRLSAVVEQAVARGEIPPTDDTIGRLEEALAPLYFHIFIRRGQVDPNQRTALVEMALMLFKAR
jgi:AcrR family transcriptional regulator